MNLRILFMLLPIALSFARPVNAQSAHGAVGLVSRSVERSATPFAPTHSLRLSRPYATDGRGMPSWVKWGLVGAAGGAILFGVLGEASIQDRRPFIQNAAFGAVSGFVTIGGAVALYNWVCAEDSSSRRAGLCGN